MALNTALATVTLRCIPDNTYALSGILNSKMARFDIETKNNNANYQRTPLNLALILDRSGSMEADNKLLFAKRAVNSVLDLLHDEDIVHLIAYDTDVSIVFENARASTRTVLHTLVDQIETAGSTNLSGGIEVAAGLLEKHSYAGFSRRMFVFSDGQANVGLKTRAELVNLVAGFNSKGIITDSFGIGADFDAEIMKGIADSGGAKFFFLESAQVIEPLVKKALISVFNVCGSQARLIVRGKNGGIVTKIWGHANIVAGATLGDLHGDNLRSILCEFTVAGGNEGNIEILTYELQYNQPDDLNGAPIIIKDTLSLTFVTDESLVMTMDPRVKTMHVMQIAADMDSEIAELVKQDQREDAIDVIVKQIALLKEVENLDDEKGVIRALIRMAENMHNKLEDESMDDELLYHGCYHYSYLKRAASCEYMDHYADED